jgi:uncharacterized membrane protein
MHDLIVVSFHNQYRAAEVLNELWRMNDDWAVDLDDAVAVYRDRFGNLRYQQSVAPTVGEGAAWGGLWGSLLGALIAAPFTAGASAAAGAAALASGALAGGALGGTTGALDASWWKDDFGISEDFVDEVSRQIGPGDSAIFAWIQSADPELVAERFRGYGGTVLRTTLTPRQSEKLEDLLHSRV